MPVYASSLIEAMRCQLGAGGAPVPPGRAVSLREALEERLTDPRKPRGIRHSLARRMVTKSSDPGFTRHLR
jgi:hypothetical protein